MRQKLLLICLLAGGIINAQSELPVFGNYSAEEKSMTGCAFDKEAGAVVLLDEAVATYDDSYHLITHRRTRIKIFSQKELDRANIRIRFRSKDKFEFIRNIKGITFFEGGSSPTISLLENKSIYTEKEDAYYSSIKFALPNVKPGSIIEYEYDSYMEHYGGLDSWTFQNELPTLKSCYLVTILPNVEFQYSVQKKRGYSIIIKPLPAVGKIYYEMNNIPGLKFEPYMDAVRDYLQKVIFQFSGYTSRATGQHTKVNTTWRELAGDLIDEKAFGGAIRNKLSKIDDVRALVAKETSDSGKLAAIYNYVRKNIEWDGYYSKYTEQGLKSTLEKRKGNSGDINLLLINLLETFDIDVSPLLIAERDFGKVDTSYPFIDRFNKVAAYVVANNRIYILDATQKYLPPGLIPYQVLNTIGFLTDKKRYGLISLTSQEDYYANNIVTFGVLDNKGILSASSKITSSGYARQIRTEYAKKGKEKFIEEMLDENNKELQVSDCVFENLDDESKPLVQDVKFQIELNESGGFVFVPYNFFLGLSKNPFAATERFTNVNFGYPYHITHQFTLTLPEKFTIDKLPPDKVITSSDRQNSVIRKLRINGNTLVAFIEFKQNTTLIPNDQYEALRSHYSMITELLREPVIVKLN